MNKFINLRAIGRVDGRTDNTFCVCYCDWYSERLKSELREPYAREYGISAQELRSILKTRDYEIKLLKGGFWKQIRESFRVLQCRAHLQYCGFHVNFDAQLPADCDNVRHPLVVFNREHAALAGLYALKLAGVQIKGFPKSMEADCVGNVILCYSMLCMCVHMTNLIICVS